MTNNNKCVYCNGEYLEPLPTAKNLELEFFVDSETKTIQAYNENDELVNSCKIKYCPMCKREL